MSEERAEFDAPFHAGERSVHNHQLVEETVRIARLFGREPATVEEARATLNLEPALQRNRETAA